MPVDKTPATDTEEKANYSNAVLAKRDKTITIPLVADAETDNDDMEKALWADYVDCQDKMKEYHKIRMALLKERPET